MVHILREKINRLFFSVERKALLKGGVSKLKFLSIHQLFCWPYEFCKRSMSIIWGLYNFLFFPPEIWILMDEDALVNFNLLPPFQTQQKATISCWFKFCAEAGSLQGMVKKKVGMVAMMIQWFQHAWKRGRASITESQSSLLFLYQGIVVVRSWLDLVK